MCGDSNDFWNSVIIGKGTVSWDLGVGGLVTLFNIFFIYFILLYTSSKESVAGPTLKAALVLSSARAKSAHIDRAFGLLFQIRFIFVLYSTVYAVGSF